MSSLSQQTSIFNEVAALSCLTTLRHLRRSVNVYIRVNNNTLVNPRRGVKKVLPSDYVMETPRKSKSRPLPIFVRQHLNKFWRMTRLQNEISEMMRNTTTPECRFAIKNRPPTAKFQMDSGNESDFDGSVYSYCSDDSGIDDLVDFDEVVSRYRFQYNLRMLRAVAAFQRIHDRVMTLEEEFMMDVICADLAMMEIESDINNWSVDSVNDLFAVIHEPPAAEFQMEAEIPSSFLGTLGKSITAPFQMVNNVEKMTAEVAGVTAELHKTTTHFTGMAKSLDDGIANIGKMLAAMVPTVSFAKDIGSILLKLVKVLATVSMTNAAHRLKAFFLEVFWNFGGEIFSLFSRMVSRYFTTDEQPDAPEAQFQVNLDDLVNVVTGGMKNVTGHWAAAPVTGALLSTLLVTACGLPSGNFDACLKFFGDRCRSMNNVVTFAKNAVPMFTMITDWILSCFRGPLVDQNLDSTLNGYAEFVHDVLELQEVSESGETLKDRLDRDEKLVFKVDALYRKGIEFSKELTNKRFGPNLTMQLNQCMKVVERMKKMSDNTGVFGNKPRMEPLVIQLFGDSGVGKSGMAWPLASDLNAAISSENDDARDFAKNIYFRNCEQEFWDGYHGQNVVCYDDFGQRVDGAANPNEEFMELIRAANIAPYPLHMAAMEEKQRTKFCSKVLLLTSNVLEQNVNSLTYSDAYRRRIKICAKVDNYDGFTYGAYSKSKGMVVPRLDTTKTKGPVDTDVYQIMLYDAETLQPLLRTDPDDPEKGPMPILMHYEMFLDYCLKEMHALWAKSRRLNADLEKRLDNERIEALRAKMQVNEEEVVDIADDCVDYANDLLQEVITTISKEDVKIPRTRSEKIRESLKTTVKAAKGYFHQVIESITSLRGVLVLLGAALVGFGLWTLFSTGPQKAQREVGEGPPQNGPARKLKRDKKAFIVGISEPAEIEAASSGDFKTTRRPVVVRENLLDVNQEATSSGDNQTVRPPVVRREAFVSGDSRTVRPKAVCREGDIVDAELQMWKDKTAQELITHRIVSNTFKISRKNAAGLWHPLLNGLFIRDSIMLAPHHLIPALKRTDTICIENINGARFEMPFSVCKYSQLTSNTGHAKDACLIQFPRYVGAYSDIVKHFQLNHDINWTRGLVNLFTLRSNGKAIMATLLGNKTAKSVDQDFTIDGETYQLREGYEYDLPTNNGDCGAPLILQEPTCLRKIAGIHTLALCDGNRAFAQSVTRADLERGLKNFSSVIKTDMDAMANLQFNRIELPLNEELSTSHFVEVLGLPAPTFAYVGECDTSVFVPGNTDIKPSVIHGEVTTPFTRPAVLYSATENLLHKNLIKCAMETPYIPEAAVEKAIASYKPLLFNGTKSHLQKVLSFEEAVQGLSEESEYLSSINRSSSPGFPWVLYRPGGTKGKTAWLGDGDYVFDDVVRQSVQSRIDAAREGVRIPCVWTDTLKDERRPLAKVAAQETRVFGNGPMDFTIAFRMYFLGFLAHIMENRINNEQSLGTNVYSGDWKATRDYLQRRGKKVIAGDFSKFDGTLNSCIMWKFVKVINEWYDDGPENALIRETFFLEVINSMHLCDGIFYMMNHSQPSGNPITTALNSFYNSVSMRIVYDICRTNAGVSVAETFNNHVNMVSYGDDNVVNFDDFVAEWFNQNTITEAYLKIGMIYTDELKSGDDMADHRLIDDVAYLKRHFRCEGERIYAPLDLKVILETCNWVREGPDAVGDCQMNCETSISELAQHPREVFETFAPKIETAFRKFTGETLRVKTYDEYEEYLVEQYYTS